MAFRFQRSPPMGALREKAATGMPHSRLAALQKAVAVLALLCALAGLDTPGTADSVQT